VDWAPNNAFFVTANRADETVRIYNASSYEVIKVHTEGQEPRSVKISKDSRYVAIGYANSRLTVLETTAWSVFMGFNTNQN
jgi:WD40 repeat protein